MLFQFFVITMLATSSNKNKSKQHKQLLEIKNTKMSQTRDIRSYFLPVNEKNKMPTMNRQPEGLHFLRATTKEGINSHITRQKSIKTRNPNADVPFISSKSYSSTKNKAFGNRKKCISMDKKPTISAKRKSKILNNPKYKKTMEKAEKHINKKIYDFSGYKIQKKIFNREKADKKNVGGNTESQQKAYKIDTTRLDKGYNDPKSNSDTSKASCITESRVKKPLLVKTFSKNLNDDFSEYDPRQLDHYKMIQGSNSYHTSDMLISDQNDFLPTKSLSNLNNQHFTRSKNQESRIRNDATTQRKMYSKLVESPNTTFHKVQNESSFINNEIQRLASNVDSNQLLLNSDEIPFDNEYVCETILWQENTASENPNQKSNQEIIKVPQNYSVKEDVGLDRDICLANQKTPITKKIRSKNIMAYKKDDSNIKTRRKTNENENANACTELDKPQHVDMQPRFYNILDCKSSNITITFTKNNQSILDLPEEEDHCGFEPDQSFLSQEHFEFNDFEQVNTLEQLDDQKELKPFPPTADIAHFSGKIFNQSIFDNHSEESNTLSNGITDDGDNALSYDYEFLDNLSIFNEVDFENDLNQIDTDGMLDYISINENESLEAIQDKQKDNCLDDLQTLKNKDDSYILEKHINKKDNNYIKNLRILNHIEIFDWLCYKDYRLQDINTKLVQIISMHIQNVRYQRSDQTINYQNIAHKSTNVTLFDIWNRFEGIFLIDTNHLEPIFLKRFRLKKQKEILKIINPEFMLFSRAWYYFLFEASKEKKVYRKHHKIITERSTILKLYDSLLYNYKAIIQNLSNKNYKLEDIFFNPKAKNMKINKNFYVNYMSASDEIRKSLYALMKYFCCPYKTKLYLKTVTTYFKTVDCLHVNSCLAFLLFLISEKDLIETINDNRKSSSKGNYIINFTSNHRIIEKLVNLKILKILLETDHDFIINLLCSIESNDSLKFSLYEVFKIEKVNDRFLICRIQTKNGTYRIQKIEIIKILMYVNWISYYGILS